MVQKHIFDHIKKKKDQKKKFGMLAYIRTSQPSANPI